MEHQSPPVERVDARCLFAACQGGGGSLLTASTQAQAASVEPTVFDNNQRCASIGVEFTCELADLAPQNSTRTVTCTNEAGDSFLVTVTLTDVGTTFDFEVDGGLAKAVIVKVGPVSNVYEYPGQGVEADTDLSAPLNPNNNKLYGLSHITFCLNEAAPQVGAIVVHKFSKSATAMGGVMDVEGATFTLTQNGMMLGEVTTDENGIACFDGLDPSLTYTLDESEAAPGFALSDNQDLPRMVTPVAGTDCDSATPIEIENDPLSNIKVEFTSQIPGATVASIVCEDSEGNYIDPDPTDETPDADEFDDTSEEIKDLIPGTYTCTIVIDP